MRKNAYLETRLQSEDTKVFYSGAAHLQYVLVREHNTGKQTNDAYDRPIRPENWSEDEGEKFSWLGKGYGIGLD